MFEIQMKFYMVFVPIESLCLAEYLCRDCVSFCPVSVFYFTRFSADLCPQIGTRFNVLLSNNISTKYFHTVSFVKLCNDLSHNQGFLQSRLTTLIITTQPFWIKTPSMPINNSRISLGDLKYENNQKTFSFPENHGTSGTLTVSNIKAIILYWLGVK